jgi:hypothetical protein
MGMGQCLRGKGRIMHSDVRQMVVPTLMVFALAAMSLSLGAQGSLNPPGAPSPVMRTLTQVEPRTPVETLPGSATAIYTIREPGSYVLSGNVSGESGKSGIEILVPHVTLDLNGFTLEGVAGSLDGVSSSQDHVTVLNGTLRSWGDDGIDLASWARVENIHAASNASTGITVGSAGLITHCLAGQNSFSGLYVDGITVVRDCVSLFNVGNGITTTSSGGQILNSILSGNDVNGIDQSAGGSWVIQGNTCTYNNHHGINVCYGNAILDNVCNDNGVGAGVTDGAGINLRCGSNLVRGNLLVDNDVGVNAAINGNHVVTQNIAIGNSGGSYNGSTGNDIGPIGSASSATSPWANIHH